MCGVAGFVGHGTRTDLVEMTNALRHRGPDSEGFYIDQRDPVFLGHRRLSVIDLEDGDQPMWSEDGQVGVVFNGEIYNHRELRLDLEAKGHRFASDHSDTEVLVHGYEEWGTDLPSRLNGMFAFAILDRRRRRLFLARDRLGEKPLYYAVLPGLFLFASEIQAFESHSGFTPELEIKALRKFFAYGFIPAPNAIWRHTAKLRHGHWLLFDLAIQRFTCQAYWQFHLSEEDVSVGRREEDIGEELLSLLRQAVRRRLVSDVPVGCFLSGGIDSSAIVSLSSGFLSGPALKTFTVGFNEPSFDESGYARRVAAHVGSDHAEDLLDLDQAFDLLPEVLGKMGEPLGDPSLLPTYLLCRFARDKVTVALSGDGGDELFAGYDTFAAMSLAAFYQRLVPKWLHRGLRSFVELLPRSPRNMSFDYRLRRALTGLSYRPEIWNSAWLSPLEASDLQALFHDRADPEDIYEEAVEIWLAGESKKPLERALEYYTNLYLPDNILTKVDRASMMVSLESRAPFLDNDLVEFAAKLPTSFKYRRGSRKYLLKKALRGVIPDEIIDRPKKGFGIPLLSWLERLPFDAKDCGGALDWNWVMNRRRSHHAGRRDDRLFLWAYQALSRSRAGSIPVTD